MRKFLAILLATLALGTASADIPAGAKDYSNPELGFEYHAPEGYAVLTDPSLLGQLVQGGISSLPGGSFLKPHMKRVGMHFLVIKLDEEGKPLEGSLNFATEDLPIGNVTPEAYRAASLASLTKVFKEIQELPHPPVLTLDGRIFQGVEYIGGPGKIDLHAVSYFNVDNQRHLAYVITFGTKEPHFAQHRADLEGALQGFRFAAERVEGSLLIKIAKAVEK